MDECNELYEGNFGYLRIHYDALIRNAMGLFAHALDDESMYVRIAALNCLFAFSKMELEIHRMSFLDLFFFCAISQP